MTTITTATATRQIVEDIPYGLERFFAAGSAFPLENETMTKCMQWKDRIANRCPIGLTPPGVMNCVSVCVCTKIVCFEKSPPALMI